MNLPNFLSISRILLVPIFLYLLFHPSPWMKLLSLAVFGIASITDFFDGWTARKLNQQSELGEFLDPFADKVLVIATLIGFLLLDPLIPVWMVLVIFARDVLITLLRYFAIKRGKAIRTSRFGKWKTAIQMISIVIIILVFIVRATVFTKLPLPQSDSIFKIDIVLEIIFSPGSVARWLLVAPYLLMLLITVLTAWSGIRYLVFNWKVLLPNKKETPEMRGNNK